MARFGGVADAIMVMVRRYMGFMVMIMLMALVLFTVLIVMSSLCEKEVISSHRDFLWRSSLILASLRWFSHPSKSEKSVFFFFFFSSPVGQFYVFLSQGREENQGPVPQELVKPLSLEEICLKVATT